MRGYALAASLTFLALLVTGCGGGGGRSANIPGGGGALSSKSGQVPTQFKITFSSASNTASYKRNPKTISSASESVVITVNGGLQQTFNIAAPQCTLGDTITCNFTVNAYVGSDTFLIQTYSGTNGTGMLLDQVTFDFTVSSTGSNTLSATLGPAVSTTADSGAGSLRAAIAAANPGDTIACFAPSLSGTITLTSGAITLAQNITIVGPGASTISVSGNNASAIFLVNSGVAATISGLTLTNGAGAACVGNSSSACGGAIQNEGTLAVNNATFTNNTASLAEFGEGGAIYSDVGATLSVANSTFSGNKAQFGGAICSESSNATITSSKFTSNTTQGGLDDDLIAEGGAVYADDDTTITGSTFTSNVSTGPSAAGGAIVQDDCTNSGLTLSSSTLNTNQVGVPANGDPSGSGGAVYDDSGCTAQLTGNTFTGNIASGTSDSYGGALEADYGSSIALLGGNAFTSNSVVSQSTSQYSAGGAIYITYYGNNLVLTGSANTFTGNTVTAGPSQSGGNANGGAIDLDSGGFLDMSGATGTTFSQNVASRPDSLGSAFGGAIEYFDGEQQEKGKARRGGPMAHNFGRPPSTQAVLRQRQFHAHGSAKAIARESTLSHARSMKRQPAVVAQQQFSNTVMATFTQNKAIGGSSSEFDVTGGAIDIEEAPSFTIVSSTFTGNQVGPSNSWGGAVSVEGSTVTLTGDIFTTNSASDGGGAVALNDTTMTLSTSTLSQNSVTSAFYTGDGGGGIYASGASVNTVTQSTIGSNTVAGNVTGTGGGGVITNDAMIQFTNDTITGNTSAMDGGGVEISSIGGCVILTNVTLYANTATNGDGGNLFLGGGNATITNSIFARGAATVGPDIVSPTATITSNDWNYIATAPNGPFATTGPDDQINTVEITLAALADNGGPTQTMSDAGVSQVVDVIPFDGGCGNSSVTQDQRALYRGSVNSKCDIGAFENGGTTTAPTSIVRRTTTKLKR